MFRYIICVIFLFLTLAQPSAQSIAWIDGGQEIVISDLEAGTQKTILSSHSAWAITSHPDSGDLYWTDSKKKAIYVTKIADKSTSLFIDGLENPEGITIDDQGKIYVLDDGIVLRYSGTGTFEKTITDDQIRPLDVYNYDNRIYFGDGIDSTISSIDLEGNNKERITGTLEYLPVSVKINELTEEIFWVGAHWGIFRTSLEGTAEIEWIHETDWPSIAIDKESNVLYYTNTMDLAKIDLSTLSRSICSEYLPARMVFNNHDSKLYFTYSHPSEVLLSLNQEEDEEVIYFSPYYNFTSLDIHHGSSRLFWAGKTGVKGSEDERVAIFSSDLEGTDTRLVHEFETDIYSFEELKVNQANQLLYWSHDRKIFSSEFDGTDVREVSQERTEFISFEYSDEKMYWSQRIDGNTDNFSYSINRSDFDGSNTEEVYRIDPYYDAPHMKTRTPTDLYVSKERGKIYWLNYLENTVNSIGLDGDEYEVLINIESLFPMSLDVLEDKMYYGIIGSSSFLTKGVYSASLDGSENALVFSGNVYDMVILPNYALSTKEKYSEASARVYPNPASSEVYVESDQSVTQVDVINLSGEILAQFIDTKTIEVSSLYPSIYFLRIEFVNGESEVLKLIKQ